MGLASAFVLLGAGCGEDEMPLSPQEYERQVLAIEDSVFDAAARVIPVGSEPTQAQLARLAGVAARASRDAVKALSRIRPPMEYQRGHGLLIRYYELEVRFHENEERLLADPPPASISELENAQRALSDEMSEVRDRLGMEIPFLRAEEIPLGELSPIPDAS